MHRKLQMILSGNVFFDINYMCAILRELNESNMSLILDDFEFSRNYIFLSCMAFNEGVDIEWPSGYIKNRKNNEELFLKVQNSMMCSVIQRDWIVFNMNPHCIDKFRTPFLDPDPRVDRNVFLDVGMMLNDNNIDLYWSHYICYFLPDDNEVRVLSIKTRLEAEIIFDEMCRDYIKYKSGSRIWLRGTYRNANKGGSFKVP